MAIIHKATITPSKAEILGSWLPRQPWFDGTVELQRIASYRFDDPTGEVGLEATIIDAGADTLFHVPCSYRAEPLAGAEDFLMGTADHSVLGTRYFYDAAGDPVWATALATAIRSGGVQADEVLPDGSVREATLQVRGSGTAGSAARSVDAVSTVDVGRITVINTDAYELQLVRRVGTEVSAPEVLTAIRTEGRAQETWVLAALSPT